MGKLLVFLAGIAAGAVLAHLASGTAAGGRLFGAVNAASDEFLRALSDSYRARRAEES